jgi:hypothetical protein
LTGRTDRPYVLAVALTALWIGLPATAADIRISGDCRSGVHLVVHEARLSDVLKRLAAALDFQLRFEADTDPLLTVDTAHAPVELLFRLAPPANVSIMTQASRPWRPRRRRAPPTPCRPRATRQPSAGRSICGRTAWSGARRMRRATDLIGPECRRLGLQLPSGSMPGSGSAQCRQRVG